MSRIGIKPIEIPENVVIKINDNIINVSGGLGEQEFLFDKNINVQTKDDQIYVDR